MDVDVSKQMITVNRLVSHQNQTIIVEGDIIVPDVKPDVLNVMDTVGNVCIYKKEVQDAKVKWDGAIQLNIIYLADTDQDSIRGISNLLDFSQSMPIEDCRAGMNMRSNITIQNIEVKVLNGRKLNVKVMLNMEAFIYSNEEIPILKEVKNVEEIQTLSSHMQINNLIGTGCCKASAKDTIHIDENFPLVEILKTEIKVCNPQTKVSYNKLLLKADANVKIMYLAENGEIKTISENIPIMGFLDMNHVSENQLINSYYEIKNMVIMPNSSEQHSIMVDIEFEICCDVTDFTDIEFIQDMYSPIAKVSFKQKEVTTMMNKQILQQTCNINENMTIPELENEQIYDVEVIPIIEQANVLEGKIVYEGNINLNFIFSTNTSAGITTQAYRLPFTYTIENGQINHNKMINTQISLIDSDFSSMTNGMVNCKIGMLFTIETYNHANIRIMDEVTIEENDAFTNPSMIIYIVKDGDTLWNIAKRYQTTVEELEQMNSLKNSNQLTIGQKLFIPRFYLHTNME